MHDDSSAKRDTRLPGILPATAIACIAAAAAYYLFGAAATVDGAVLLLLGVFLAMSSLTAVLWHRLEQGLGAAPVSVPARRRVNCRRY